MYGRAHVKDEFANRSWHADSDSLRFRRAGRDAGSRLARSLCPRWRIGRAGVCDLDRAARADGFASLSPASGRWPPGRGCVSGDISAAGAPSPLDPRSRCARGLALPGGQAGCAAHTGRDPDAAQPRTPARRRHRRHRQRRSGARRNLRDRPAGDRAPERRAALANLAVRHRGIVARRGRAAIALADRYGQEPAGPGPSAAGRPPGAAGPGARARLDDCRRRRDAGLCRARAASARRCDHPGRHGIDRYGGSGGRTGRGAGLQIDHHDDDAGGAEDVLPRQGRACGPCGDRRRRCGDPDRAHRHQAAHTSYASDRAATGISPTAAVRVEAAFDSQTGINSHHQVRAARPETSRGETCRGTSAPGRRSARAAALVARYRGGSCDPRRGSLPQGTAKRRRLVGRYRSRCQDRSHKSGHAGVAGIW